ILQTLETYNATARARGKPVLVIHAASAEEVLKRLKTGKTPLVVEPTPSQPLVYHYAPSRPEAVTARAAVDDLLQESAGRKNPIATEDITKTEPGSRYIDFLIPGLIGVNTMGGG